MKNSRIAPSAMVARWAVAGAAAGGAVLLLFNLMAHIPSCSSELYACGTLFGIIGALALMVAAFPLVLVFGFHAWLVPLNLAAVGATIAAAKAFFQRKNASTTAPLP